MFDSLAVFATVIMVIVLMCALASMIIIGLYAHDKAGLDKQLDKMRREAVEVAMFDQEEYRR